MSKKEYSEQLAELVGEGNNDSPKAEKKWQHPLSKLRYRNRFRISDRN